MKLIYHYTSGSHLEKILQDGKLIVSEWERNNKVKPPALWLSTNPVWEQTATKLMQAPNGEIRPLSKDEQHTMFGLYRFVLTYEKEKLCTWKKYKYKSNTTHLVYEAMEKAGTEKGANPDEWFATFENIPLKNCLKCEVWDGKTWQLHIDFKA